MLAARGLALPFNNEGVPVWEDRLARLGWSPIGRLIGRALEIRPGIEVEDEAAVWHELDLVGERLSDGRPYLSGERFGAADITFAALAAAVLVPPEYGTPLPQPEVLPPAMAAIVRRAREHPAGRHALALYDRHRREVVG
jgi:glutathione S-transferase